jgi:hypothetical protein
LPALKPLLEGLRAAMRELRDGDWNEDATDLHGGAHGDRPHGNEQPTP